MPPGRPSALTEAQKLLIIGLSTESITSVEIATAIKAPYQAVASFRSYKKLPRPDRGRPLLPHPSEVVLKHAARIKELADQGMYLSQIAREMNLTRERVRQIAFECDLVLPKYRDSNPATGLIATLVAVGKNKEEIREITGFTRHKVRYHLQKGGFHEKNKERMPSAKDKILIDKIRKLAKAGYTRVQINVALGRDKYHPGVTKLARKYGIEIKYSSEGREKTSKALVGKPRGYTSKEQEGDKYVRKA